MGKLQDCHLKNRKQPHFSCRKTGTQGDVILEAKLFLLSTQTTWCSTRECAQQEAVVSVLELKGLTLTAYIMTYAIGCMTYVFIMKRR